jgi:hypothetical protein
MMRNTFKSCLAVVAVALIVGCASAPKGPTDEELLAQVVTQWEQSVVAKDLDAMMALYSESFSNAEAADKAAWRSYLEWIMASGYIDGAEVDVSGAETTIEEGTATIGPLVLSSAGGIFNIGLDLAKEEAGWLIVGQTSQ